MTKLFHVLRAQQLIGLIFVLSCLTFTQAQTYPQYQDLFVNDYANVISTADAGQIRAQLQSLKAETGIEITVLTLASYRDYATGDNSIESFATNLFNRWGIGNALSNNGALILVAVDDREMRIELGSGYSSAYDRSAKLVIDEYMLPAFRQDDYSRGIVRGAEELALSLVTPAAQSTPSSSATPSHSVSQPSTPSYNSPRNTVDLNNPYGWGGAIAALLGGGGGGWAFLRRRQRYKARNCHNCNHALERLDEVSDNVYLDDGERTEEYLRSVDYDIWHCSNCNEYEFHRYPALFSSYKTCPSCNYRTLSITSHTLVAATCHSGGSNEITESCHNKSCDYDRTRVLSTPARNCDDDNSSSFSSSSDSFGGGSSSGGGSSGSW